MKTQWKRIICISLMVILVIGCCSTVSFGATKTKTMKVYSECVKIDNMVYCIAPDGLYKVNLKNKKKTRLVKISYPAYENYEWIKYYKGYIYGYFTSIDDYSALKRVRKDGKNKTLLAYFYTYDTTCAISKNKVYYRYSYYDKNDNEKFAKRKMNLNGKKKKKTSIKAKNKYLHTNNKYYRIKTIELDDGYTNYYLKTKSGGMIYLTSVNWDEEEVR